MLHAAGEMLLQNAPRPPSPGRGALDIPPATAVAGHWSNSLMILLLLIIAVAGCTQNPPDRTDDGRLPVFAGIQPTAYLVEQVGGARVAVDVLVRQGQDPHTFEPTPRQVSDLSGARLFFKIGLPFEDVLLAKMRDGAPRLKIVDVAADVPKRTMDAPCCDHDAGHNHDHAEHGGPPDPHVWLSPPLLKTQAKNVAAALVAADPDHAEEYRENLAALLERIEAVHRRIERKLAPYRGRSFIVFHPGFGYFADAYGLRELAIESGGRSPTPKQIHALIAMAQAEGANTLFVQPQFDPNSVKPIADAIGGTVASIDGLQFDVLSNYEEIAEKLEKSFIKEEN